MTFFFTGHQYKLYCQGS
uniref:Uncharacterized protein n=1 Tax=Arundo donax TaxID=35708 RepID=A0A0A9C1Y9_ARUDO